MDSSDDEENPNDNSQPFKFHPPSTVATTGEERANEDGISTSGQVDEGQFRLVPNTPEDDFYNRRHPPVQPSHHQYTGQGTLKDENGPRKRKHSDSNTRSGRSDKSSRSDNTSATRNEAHAAASSESPPPPPHFADLSFNLETLSSQSYPSAGTSRQDEPNLGQDSLTNPIPGSSRPQETQPREDKRPGTATGSGLDDDFLPVHELQLRSYQGPDADDDEAPLSASFQGVVDATESSFGHPVDLEDIQLQKLVPENPPHPPSTTPAQASSSCPNEGPSTSAGFSSPNSANKYLLVPELQGLKADESMASSSGQRNVTQQPNGSQRLGMAFTGIPSSLQQAESDRIPSEAGNSSNVSSNNNSQHSSILESMTGPLSKRLRTLHNLQQKNESSEGVQNKEPSDNNGMESQDAAGPSSNARSLPPMPLSSQNGKHKTLGSEQQQNQESTGGEKSKGGSNDEDGKNSKNGNDSSSDSNGNGNGPPFFGGTQQTYSVTIETTGIGPASVAMKPKKLFQQKSINGQGELFESLIKGDTRNNLVRGISDSQKDCIALGRPKRQRKERRHNWCDDEDDLRSPLLQIVDNPVESRARATVPSTHLTIRPTRKGAATSFGVFTKKRIPKGTRFGPVEGKLLHFFSKPEKNSFLLLVKTESEGSYEIDVSDENASNWMSLVRPATNMEEQNTIVHQDGIHLYFSTSRTIARGQELRVWYSPEYADVWDLQLLGQEKNQNSDTIWPCYNCEMSFHNYEEFHAHLSEHGDRTIVSNEVPSIPKRVFSCNICHRKFSKESSLQKHAATHRVKNNECDKCNFKFSNSKGLAKHRKTCKNQTRNSQREAERSSRCPDCGLWFKSSPVFSIHQLGHLNTENESHAHLFQKGGFVCPECDECFDSCPKLIDHSLSHGTPTKPLPSYNCKSCYRSFNSEDKLEVITCTPVQHARGGF